MRHDTTVNLFMSDDNSPMVCESTSCVWVGLTRDLDDFMDVSMHFDTLVQARAWAERLIEKLQAADPTYTGTGDAALVELTGETVGGAKVMP